MASPPLMSIKLVTFRDCLKKCCPLLLDCKNPILVPTHLEQKKSTFFGKSHYHLSLIGNIPVFSSLETQLNFPVVLHYKVDLLGSVYLFIFFSGKVTVNVLTFIVIDILAGR